MILLQAFLDLDGLAKKIELTELAVTSLDVLQRKRQLITEVPDQFQNTPLLDKQLLNKWYIYWEKNPVAAWIGKNRSALPPFFILQKEEFGFNNNVMSGHVATMASLTQELINYRILQYEARGDVAAANVVELKREEENKQSIPYFTDLKIACGHFRTSEHSSKNIDYIPLPVSYGNLDPAKHFIACASGNSMQGGKNPIKDGDYLLLELVTSVSAGSISNLTMAIERQDAAGDDQYLLRDIKKRPDGGYDLIARNLDYPIFQADDGMRTFARLKMVIDPLDLALHDSFMRENVPPLFGYEFNVGAWQSGHVTIKKSNNQFLFVTLNKQGKQKQHQYHDYFIDKDHFHWQSQNSTDPKSGKGNGIIEHEKNGSNVYLFVRKNKLEGKIAAPFIYCGALNYERYTGAKPMSVIWRLIDPLTDNLFDYYKL